jgi:hypothetical protein
MNQRLSESMRSWKRFWVLPVIVAFIMTAFAGAVQAGEPDERGGWEFRTALYMWALSLEGDVTVKGQKSDVDVGFDDILDELNFAGMLAFSGRKGNWGFWGDAIYANLGHTTHIGGIIRVRVDPDMNMLMLTGGGSYRLGNWVLSDRPGKEVPTVAVDALVGVRYTYLDITLDFDLLPDPKGDQDWVDPLVGARSLWALSKRWNLSLAGGVGGFGVGSHFTWHAHSLVGYRFDLLGEDNAQVFGGYRALYQDYTDGSGVDKFEWDVTLHGPILGLSIHF